MLAKILVGLLVLSICSFSLHGARGACLWTRQRVILSFDRHLGLWQGRQLGLRAFDRLMLLPEDRPAGLEAFSYRLLGSGKWGPWIDFETAGATGRPSPNSATGVELRLRIPSVAAGEESSLLLLLGRDGMAFRRDVDSARAPGPRSAPWFVSRHEWKARAPREPYDRQVPERITIHHTWRPTRGQYRLTATMRGIQNYHMDSVWTGWNDVGYHFLIGPDGWIYQGRPADVVGSHCVPNTGKIGVSLVGDYDPGGDELSAEAWRSLVALNQDLCRRWDLPSAFIDGHRDYSSKTCPGETVYRRLPELSAEVDRSFAGRKEERP